MKRDMSESQAAKTETFTSTGQSSGMQYGNGTPLVGLDCPMGAMFTIWIIALCIIVVGTWYLLTACYMKPLVTPTVDDAPTQGSILLLVNGKADLDQAKTKCRSEFRS